MRRVSRVTGLLTRVQLPPFVLQCAEATVSDAVDHLTLNDRSLVCGASQHIETARALIDAVLDGVGVQRIFPSH